MKSICFIMVLTPPPLLLFVAQLSPPRRVSAPPAYETFSPVIDRWVPVLERGLSSGGAHPTASGSDQDGDEERLQWSGLHVALQV